MAALSTAGIVESTAGAVCGIRRGTDGWVREGATQRGHGRGREQLSSTVLEGGWARVGESLAFIYILIPLLFLALFV